MTADTALKTLDLVVPVTRAELKAAFRTVAKQSHPDATHRKDSTLFRTAKDAYMLLLPLVPLAAGVDEDVDIDDVDEPEPTYTYTPPPEPAPTPPPRHYRCGRCGKTFTLETAKEARRKHWAERQDYPGCPPSVRARMPSARPTPCRADGGDDDRP